MRKGFVGDIPVVIVIIFGLALSLLIGHTILAEFESAATPLGLDTNLTQETTGAMELFDGVMVFLFIGLIALVVIGAFMIESHPIFFLLGVLGLIVVLIIAVIMSQLYEEVASVDVLSGAANEFTMTALLFENLPLLLAGAGMLVLVVMFGKR